jgi:uncharacterized RDD family membrane protein YckC
MTENYQLASLTSRMGAYLTDLCLLILLAVILTLPVEYFQIKHDAIVFYPILFGLMYLIDKRTKGQSLGKNNLKIKVVDSKSLSRATLLQIVIRNIFRLVPFDIFFIFGKKRQRLGDKLSGTIVINV